jgi:hypothetical protein
MKSIRNYLLAAGIGLVVSSAMFAMRPQQPATTTRIGVAASRVRTAPLRPAGPRSAQAIRPGVRAAQVRRVRFARQPVQPRRQAGIPPRLHQRPGHAALRGATQNEPTIKKEEKETLQMAHQTGKLAVKTANDIKNAAASAYKLNQTIRELPTNRLPAELQGALEKIRANYQKQVLDIINSINPEAFEALRNSINQRS